MANLALVQNDTASALVLTCVDQSGTPIDLSGAQVSLLFYINTTPSGGPLARSMTVTDAGNGVAQYTFGVSNGVYDLSEPGTLYFRTRIVFADGTVVTSPKARQIPVVPTI